MVDPDDIDDERLRAANPERPRGILTRRERKYYLGLSDIEPATQTERTLRQGVRTHLEQTILDFTILYQTLEERDLAAVMAGQVEIEGERRPTNYVGDSATDMIAFLFRHFEQEFRFERLVTEGIERAVKHDGLSARVTVDIDVRRGEPIEEIRTRLEEDGLDEVSESDLRTLHDVGELDPVRYGELMAEKGERREATWE